MPRFAPNKMPAGVKRRYFELIRQGCSGSEAARSVGVSLSCGSLWFIDAGSVTVIESAPISSRYFDQDDRIEIADGLARGESVKSIAVRIGKSFQSVYKEIGRTRKPDGSYQPWFAHNHAYVSRRRPKTRVFETDPGLRDVVAVKLEKKWSPAQISRWLRRRYPRRPTWHVCAETIYDAVYRGLVVEPNTQNLRTGRTYRRRRGRGRSKDGTWQRSAIATLIERKTRMTVLVKLEGDHSAQTVGDALIGAFSRLPASLCRTLTWDQGNEMFHHQRLESQTGLKVFFADPHSPWQRGSNENANGLLRQYYPKGTDLSGWSQDHLDGVATELNDRPRECLNDLTPHQAIRRLGHRRARHAIRDVR